MPCARLLLFVPVGSRRAPLRFALQLAGEECVHPSVRTLFSSSRAARVISRQQEKAAVCVSDPPPAAESRGASKKRTGTVKNIRAFGSSSSLHDPRASYRRRGEELTFTWWGKRAGAERNILRRDYRIFFSFFFTSGFEGGYRVLTLRLV